MNTKDQAFYLYQLLRVFEQDPKYKCTTYPKDVPADSSIKK